MKLDLSKWNPFKFLRRSPEDRRSESSGAMAMAAPAGAAAPWMDASRQLSVDPFRLMQDVLRDPFAGFTQLDRWFGDFSPSAFQPRIDVIDDGDAVRIAAELPGMDRQDVQVQIEDDMLVLRGHKKVESKNEEKGCYRTERAFGGFQRVIPLPDGVDVERAEASFDKGVLTVRLPKNPAHQPGARKIEVR